MCRWFAYISPTEPCLLTDVLITPANGLTKQVSAHYLPYLLPHGKETDLAGADDRLLRFRNSLLNYDGYGLAWYTPTSSAFATPATTTDLPQIGQRPALYKSSGPPTTDANLTSICDNTETTCLFAHIRASSGSAVTTVNSHPFTFGRHTFMHNGSTTDWTSIQRTFTSQISSTAWSNVKGTTDSEAAAAMYMTHLCGASSPPSTWQKSYTLEEMATALQKTITSILETQLSVLGSQAQSSSLNYAATDGTKMVTCRFRNNATEQPASLYFSTTAGIKLNRKYPGSPDEDTQVDLAKHVWREEGDDEKRSVHGRHVIVASEPTTYDEDEWTLIGKNCLLMIEDGVVRGSVDVLYDQDRLNFQAHRSEGLDVDGEEVGESGESSRRSASEVVVQQQRRSKLWGLF